MARGFLALLLIWTVAGCGSASSRPSGGFGAGYLERALPNGFDRSLIKVSDVSCVRKTDRTYQCLAMVEPTMRAIRQEYKGVGMTEAELVLARRQESGRTTYEVTVDPDTGKFVARPG